MSFQSKQPPSRVMIGKDKYNKLITILELNVNNSDGDIECKGIKLLDKIRTYGVPRTLDTGEEIVDIRFFPNEVFDMLNQLLFNLEEIQEADHYNELLEKIKK